MRVKGCKIKYWVLAIVGVLLATLGGVLYPIVDHVIREEVKKKVIIANNSDSESWEIFQDNPIPLYIQYHIFNLENPSEVLDGKKPAFSQRGPYTYKERRLKYNIVWNDNGTVTYNQNRTYHFIPEMSVGPESEEFLTLNPILTGLSQAIKWMPPALNTAVSAVLYLFRADGAFIRKPAREIIWGYDDPMLVLLNKIMPRWFNRTEIGYFMRKNNTDMGRTTVETGSEDIDHLGTIRSWFGRPCTSIWTTRGTNMINGTDGTTFPPFSFHNKEIIFYLTDICRSLKGHYQGHVKSPQGIKLRRFVLKADNFQSVTENPDNLVDGVRIPIIASYPHFLYADPSIQHSVVGLHPNVEEHQATIDIEPWTGFPMQISNRAQVNFFVEKVPGVMQLKNISRLFFPIMWLNESLVVDDEHADMVKDKLFLPMDIMRVVKISLIVIGGLLLLTAVGLFVWNRRKESQLNEPLLDEKKYVSYEANGSTDIPNE